MSILLGIDLGERRIGVAVGDTQSGAVTPLLTLRRASTPEADAAVIARIGAERDASAIVVGLPLHMDGSESEQARRTRGWAAAVEATLDVPLLLQDERLSSEVARRRLGTPPRGRSGGPPSERARRAWRARIDREAAAAIVQAALDQGAHHRIEVNG